MPTVGDAVVDFLGDRTRLNKDLAQSERDTKTWSKRVGGGVKNALGGMFKVAGGMLAAQVVQRGIGAVKNFMTGAIDAGANATEALGKFDVTFGDMAESASDDLDAFAASTGRSRYELKEMATDFGAVLKGMGLNEKATAGYSTKLASLAVDVASFNNELSPEVMHKFRSAMTGEYESLKSLGIVLNEAKLKQELLNMGVKGGTKAATDAQKVQARFNLIMAATVDAQGDAARTAGSWANQQVALKAVWNDFMTDVGLGATEAIGPMLEQVVELGRKALPKLAKTITGKVLPGIGQFVTKGIELGGVIADLVRTGKTDKPIEEMFGPGAVRAIEVIQETIEGVKTGGVLGWLRSLFASAWTGLKKKAATEWGPKLWAALTNAWTGLKTKATTEWGPKLWTALTNAWTGLKTKAKTEWGPRLWTALTTAWEGLKEKASEWKEKLQTAIGAAWEGLKEKAPEWKEKLQTAIGTAWEGLKEKAPEWKEKLRTAIGAAWEGLKEKAPEWGAKLKAAATTAWDTIQEEAPVWGEKLKAAATTAWDTVQEEAPVWGAKLKAAVTTAWDYIQEDAPMWKEKLQTALTTAWDGLEEKAPAWGAKLNTVVEAAITWFQEDLAPSAMRLGTALGELLLKAQEYFIANKDMLGNKIGEAIGTIIRFAIGGLIAGVAVFGTLLFNFFKGLVSNSTERDHAEMQKAVIDFFGGILNGLMTGLTGDPQWAAKLGQFFVGLWDNVKTWADEVATKIEGMGPQIVAGFIKGIKDAWGGVKGMFTELIGQLPTWAQKLLGIASASKVSMYWGEMVGLGFAKGLDKSEASVLEKVGDWINAIVGAFKMLNQMGGSGAGAFDENALQARVDGISRLLLYLVDRFQHLQNLFGYDQIKKLQNTAKRFTVILGAILIDLSGIKGLTIPDIGAWFLVLMDVFQRAMGILGQINAQYGAKLLEEVAKSTGSVTTILQILGVDLNVTAPPVNFQTVLIGFLAALIGGAPLIIDALGQVRATYGDVLEESATTADFLTKILSVLGLGKQLEELTTQQALGKGEKRIPLVTALTNLVKDLGAGADILIPAMLELDTKYGSVLEVVVKVTEKIKAAFGGIADAAKSAAEVSKTTFKLGSFEAGLNTFMQANQMAVSAFQQPAAARGAAEPQEMTLNLLLEIPGLGQATGQVTASTKQGEATSMRLTLHGAAKSVR